MPIIIFAALIISALVGGSYIADGGNYLTSQIPFGKKNEQSVVISPTPLQQPTRTPLRSPTATPKPKPAVKGVRTSRPKSTPTSYPTTDPDPIVDCTFTYLGARRMKRSECSKSFECEIGSKWYIYTSRAKCNQDQSDYWSNYYNTNPLPTYTPAPTKTEQQIRDEVGIVECKTSSGTYWLLKEDCEETLRWEKEQEQKAQEELEQQWQQFLTDENARKEDAQKQKQEKEKAKKDCIDNANRLFDELCTSQRQLNKDASCEMLKQETYRQITNCEYQ